MTRAIFSLRFIMLIWTGIFFHLSFAQADGWCLTRFTKDNTTSSTELEVVDNPMKEIGTNESSKVLKLSNIDRRGCICLNLTRYIGDAKDRITDIGNYDRLRFKYYIVNSLYTDYKVRIRMDDGVGDVVDAQWSNTDKNWKTATFSFPKNSEATWIQIQTYYTSIGVWDDRFPGMEIYLDDIELLDSDYAITPVDMNKENDIIFCQKARNLVIKNLQSDAVVSVYDMFGRILLAKDVDNYEIKYDFPKNGLYVVAIRDKREVYNRKIMISD